MLHRCRPWPLALVAISLGSATSVNALQRLALDTAKCTMARNGEQVPCHRLVLRQSDDHTLRIRIAGSNTSTTGSIRLTYVSRETTNNAALQCNNQSCRLGTTTWKGRVTSGSWITFNNRGLPNGSSNAELMTGECRISRKQVICDSQTAAGDVLRAEARL